MMRGPFAFTALLLAQSASGWTVCRPPRGRSLLETSGGSDERRPSPRAGPLRSVAAGGAPGIEEGGTSAPPAAEAEATPSSPEAAKASLLRLALVGGRGAWSRPDESDEAARLVGALERTAAAEPPARRRPVVPRDGAWELAYSDVEPFRASVFFLALAEAVEARIRPNASDGAITVHSLATGGGEVGRVAHVVEGGGTRLHSLVELRSGSLPSLPVALTGTVISSGELSRAGDRDEGGEFFLTLKNTTVQESKVKYGLPSEGGLQPNEEPNVLSWIGQQLVPSGDIFASVLDPIGGGQTALLRLSYADDDFMVWRTPRLGDAGGHFFCFVRGDERAWPAMEQLRENQKTAKQSTVGSAFAFGMLNPFFTRRAGVKK